MARTKTGSVKRICSFFVFQILYSQFCFENWNNVRNHMDARIYNYVYFPKTQRLYNVEFEKPRYIRNIGNDYRRFFFGTLNNR